MNKNDTVITGEILLLKNIQKMPTLLEPLLPQVGLSCIAGSSDTGKSAFLRQLSMAICSGMSTCFGMTLNSRYNRVIYVSTEDDEIANAYLLQRQNQTMGIKTGKLKDLIFIFEFNNLIEEIEKILQNSQVDMIVIDCFSDLYTGGMNESNQVRAFLNDFSRLSIHYQCLIMFLHHCGKRTENLMPSKHNLLGSQAFEAKMRLVLELRNDNINSQYKHLCCVKGNYLPVEDKEKSIKLLFSEDLIFTDTGNRVPFHCLTDTKNKDEAKYNAIIQYKQDGHTYEEIAKLFGYKDKSSVTKFVQRYEAKYGNVYE